MKLEPSVLRGIVDPIPPGSNLVLLGPPGSGKSLICENIIKDALNAGIKALYLTTSSSPSAIRNSLSRLGIPIGDAEKNGSFGIIDCYSWLVGTSDERYRIGSLSDLTELSHVATSAIDSMGSPLLLVFDNVSSLLVHNSEDIVLRFLQIFFARMKKMGNIGFYVVESGIHSNAFYNTIFYFSDGVFTTSIVEERGVLRRYFRVRSFRGGRYLNARVPFEIGPNGEVLMEKYARLDEF